MTTKLVELKPCPFCGGKALRFKRDKAYYGESYFIGCKNANCNVRPHTDSYDRQCDATKAWNRRANEKKEICKNCKDFIQTQIGQRGAIYGSCKLKNTSSYTDTRFGRSKACKMFKKKDRRAKDADSN